MIKKGSGFYVDFRRPTEAAKLSRMLDQVRRSGKFIRKCPDLADLGLEGGME